MLEQAAAACGLDDFGSDYEEGLEVLVESIRTDVRPIHAGNVPQLSGPLLGLLVSRARSQEGWKKRPDCLRQPLRAPLVVTGIPRTGTTALHKLLSMDSRFQGLEQWLIGSPIRKMISPVARIAKKVFTKPLLTSIVAPTASSTRKDAAPKAVFATRSSDHLRKLCGVNRNA